MAQAVPSKPLALCWYGNRLPGFTSRAMSQQFVLTVYCCGFKISGELSSLLSLPFWTFKVNLFFFLQSCQVISFPIAFPSGALCAVQHTPLWRDIGNACLFWIYILAVPNACNCWTIELLESLDPVEICLVSHPFLNGPEAALHF